MHQTKRPFEHLGIPGFARPALALNTDLFTWASDNLLNHDQPIIPAWCMWDKSTRIAEWEYLYANYGPCVEWSLKAARSAHLCVRMLINKPLPPNYAHDDDRPFAPYGLMVDDREELRNRKWLKYFESGICWALVGGHRTIATELAILDVGSLPYDQTEVAATKFAFGIRNYLLGLDCKEQLSSVISSPDADSYWRSLSRAMLSAISKDCNGYRESFEHALRVHIHKRLLKRLGNEVPVFPLSANIIWHLAEELDMYPCLLPFLQHHLFVIQDLDLGAPRRKEKIASSIPNAVTPADRLGIVVQISDDTRYLNTLKLRDTGNEFSTREFVADSLVGCTNTLAKERFLLGHWDEFRKWCKTLLECVEHFFFGAFRSEHKEFWTWVYNLQYGIGWGSVGGLWRSIDKLLAYPIDSLKPDSEGKCAHQFYVGLTEWWKDRNNMEWVERVKNVRGAGSKYYHLLADSTRSIAKKDNAGFNKNIEKSIQQYYKSAPGNFEFPMAAIFLRNLAEREGLTVSVPAEVDDYLFRLPMGPEGI